MGGWLEFDFIAISAQLELGLGLSLAKNKDFPFNVYTILYDACVTSISDYAGEVTGHTQYSQSVQLHVRAIRAYLGLPKNSCSVGVMSEVDWLLPEYRTKIRMIRQYHRMLKMDESRLTKKVYLWDRSINNRNVVSSWTNEVKNIFYSCGLHLIFDDEIIFPLKLILDNIKAKFKIDQADYLKNECLQQSKLRTFNKFKQI